LTQGQVDGIGMRGTNEGGKLKETGDINWDPLIYHWHFDIGATNETGFTALPGGYRHFFSGEFTMLGYDGQFWSSSEFNTTDAWKRVLWYNSALIGRSYENKKQGISVRCIKD
jgi:uncharacterized protein (TIGR02145 family)